MRHSLSGQAGLLCELLTAAMDPQLQEAGITLGTFELLSAVHASGGRATQVEIAKRLGITPPSLSESVKSATTRLLLEQHSDSEDARRKILKLTPKGRKAMLSIVKAVNNAEIRMVNGIDDSQLSTVIEVLARANRNLARIIEEDSNTSKHLLPSNREQRKVK